MYDCVYAVRAFCCVSPAELCWFMLGDRFDLSVIIFYFRVDVKYIQLRIIE